jgi:PKD repeat protein
MKKLLLFLTSLLVSMTTMALTTDSLWVSGHVTNIANGAPIANKTVAIEIDSLSGWAAIYVKNADSSGRYLAHVPVNAASGFIKIEVWDCNLVMHRVTRYYDLNATPDTIYQDFQICDSGGSCHALYTYMPGQTDPQNIQFQDLSSGNPISWQWVFSDPGSGSGNFSTLQNPTHIFSSPGHYNVCLTIQGADSLCHDTYCSPVAIDSTITLHIYGTVTDSISHNPIPYHPIIIDNDSMDGSFYPHHRIVYANINGIYNDTLFLPSGVIPWRFIIRTFDANNNQYYYGTGYYGGPPVTQHDFSIYSCPNSTCQATFYPHPDSISPLTIHFVPLWTGNIDSWYWNFGDGTSSNDPTPTHTFMHAGEIYHVCLMVKNSANNCCDVYCKDVIPGFTGCQANFVFYYPQSGSDGIVHFADGSTGNPTSWMWNFDDTASGSGNLSTLQNPDHIFSLPGTHNICLTISGDSCSSTFCRDVMIPDSVNYHQVYGQVFAGDFPLHTGDAAQLFSKYSGQTNVPYTDITIIDSNGVYIFDQVPDGKYVISVVKDFFIPEGYLLTWYGDVFMWEQATEIVLDETNKPYNIHLVPIGSPVPGPGLISGQINSEFLPSQILGQVKMILMDANMKPISVYPLDTTGEFTFSSLDYGIYYLHPEEMSLYGDIVKVEITEAKPHGEVVMTLTGNHILGTGNLQTKAETVLIYPNPVTDQLTISINLMASNKISIDVWTISGQVVLTMSKNVSQGLSTVTLPFTGLAEGMYIVKIHSDEGINVVKRVIKSR